MKWITENFKKIPPKPKDWYSVADIVRISGESDTKARKKLKEMKDRGELITEYFMQNGAKTLCYKKK